MGANEIIAIVFIIIFALLGAAFIYLYFVFKSKDEEFKMKYVDYSPWSLKGFWAENRLRLILISSVIFFLIAFSLCFEFVKPETTSLIFLI